MSTEMEILSAVNGFYENAFGQLLQYTLAIIAFVGVVIPFIVGLIQWRSLKSEKENLERLIASETTAAKKAMRSELINELTALVRSEEDKLTSRIEEKFSSLDAKLSVARAGTFHIQGNASLKSSNYASACVDFCNASTGYLKGKDEVNGQRTIRLLIENGLPKVTKSLYEQHDLEIKINELIEFLESINENNRYSDRINALRIQSRNAKERPVKSPENTTK